MLMNGNVVSDFLGSYFSGAYNHRERSDGREGGGEGE